jgi:hypothetical protein
LLWFYGGVWVALGLMMVVVRRRWQAGRSHVHERAADMVQSGESLH